jgi:hypothetical protein
VLPARHPDTCVQSTTITLPGALADIIPAIIQNEPATSGQSVRSFVLHRQLILSRPSTKAAFNSHSSRVRRKRQRLPSSLLIENVSAVSFTASPQHFHAETFPIKASDYTFKWNVRAAPAIAFCATAPQPRTISKSRPNGRRKFCSVLADSHCVGAPSLASAAFG